MSSVCINCGKIIDRHYKEPVRCCHVASVGYLSSRTEQQELAVCIHRSDQIGYVDCGCGGHPKAYRCAKFIRPYASPPEQAFCVPYLPAKRFKIVEMDKRTVIAEIRRDELLECFGCEAFEAAEPYKNPCASES